MESYSLGIMYAVVNPGSNLTWHMPMSKFLSFSVSHFFHLKKENNNPTAMSVVIRIMDNIENN